MSRNKTRLNSRILGTLLTLFMLIQGCRSGKLGDAGLGSSTAASQAPQLVLGVNSLPTGVQGNAYNFPLQISGGTPPFSWSLVTGSLPLNVSVSSGGVVSGTPGSAGSFSPTFLVVDSSRPAQSLTVNSNMTVETPLSVMTQAVPNVPLNNNYALTLSSQGGSGPFTWTVSAGSLPPGVTLNTSTGALSGKASTSGTYSFSLTVADGIQTSSPQNYSMVVETAMAISTLSLPSIVSASSYSQTLATVGGSGGFTWGLSSGSLPPGMTLNTSTGVISGSCTTAGSYSFVVSAADSVQSSTQNLSINVEAPLVVKTLSLPDAVKGVSYSQILSSQGGSGTLSWALASGSLPAGLTFNTSTGTVSGTPTTSGSVSIGVKVSDSLQTSSAQTLGLTVENPLTISTTSFPNVMLAGSYSQTLASSGGAGTLNWSISSGTLPLGLTLNSATGVISGTPSLSGTCTFGILVTDAVQSSSPSTFTITVESSISITSTALPNGLQNAAYSQTLGYTGGSGAPAWSLSSGTLPTGLSLAPSGVISGTPTTAGTFSATVKASDTIQSATQNITIVIEAPLVVKTASLPDAVKGISYSQVLSSQGGTGSLTWALASGSLPAGLTLNASTGTVSGIPTASGSVSIGVKVSDSLQTSSAQTLGLTVENPLTVSTTSLPNVVLAGSYSQTLAASGGAGTLTWSISSGALPSGLSLNAATGVISGTPSLAGTSTFGILVTDAVQSSAASSLSIIVEPFISITSTTLPNGLPNAAYSKSLSATGGSGTLTWSLSSGALPTGLSLASSGVISGTPTTPGTFSATVKAADALQSATQNISIVIEAPLVITTAAPLATGVQGKSYTQSFASTGGGSSVSWSWSVAAGGTLSGLALSPGILSGTPTTSGTFTISIVLSDPLQSVSKGYFLTIEAPIAIQTTSLPNGVKGTAYSSQLSASGGASLSWTATGLPLGLSISASGLISGTPTGSGSSSVTVTASDPLQSASSNITINIVAPTPTPVPPTPTPIPTPTPVPPTPTPTPPPPTPTPVPPTPTPVPTPKPSPAPTPTPSPSACTGSYKSTVLALNPVGYWQLNETSGTVAADATHYADNGTYQSIAALGVKPGALALTTDAAIKDMTYGTTLSVPNASQLSSSTAITTAVWVYLNDYGTGYYAMIPVDKSTTTADSNYALYVLGATSNDGGMVALYANAGGVWQSVTNFSTPISLSHWHFLVATYDSTTGGNLYIDGVSVVATKAAVGLLTVNTAPLISTQWPNSEIEQISVFNYVLTAAQIAQIYQASSSTCP